MSIAVKEHDHSNAQHAPAAQKWLLQIRRGELRLVNDLSELVRLVLERRVERGALLYPITESPRPIGDMPELARLFDGGTGIGPALPGSDGVDIERSFESEEVPYLDSISPLGSTEQAFGEDYYLPARSRAPQVLAGLVVLIIAAGGAYLGWQRMHSEVATASPPAPIAVAPVALPPPAPAAPAPAAPAPAAPAPVATLPPPPPPQPEPAPAPASTSAPAPAPAPSPPPAAAAAAPAKSPPPAPAPAPAPRSYDELIAEGDRLIEGGRTKRAMTLFEQASKLRPNGAAALTGLAYGWLDRGDAARAVSLFQRALGNDAGHAPALFGLGEALREQGRRREALDAFRRYLTRFPAHREANAARRQVEQLAAAR